MHRRRKPIPSAPPSHSVSSPEDPPTPVSCSFPVYPSFLVLALIRLAAALTHPIADCDETFNYWEPLHYLLFSHGLQTWEYSPTFALRSYAYLLPPALLARISFLIYPSKITAFYVVRIAQGLLSTYAEIAFCKASATIYGTGVARLLFCFLLTSPGVFRSSIELLPSSFAMISLTVAFTAWMRSRTASAVFFVALASLLGWIFAAALAIPLALDILIKKNGLATFILYAMLSAICIIPFMTAVDSYYYGKLVVTPLNHILYNVFPTQGTGSHLFGVEGISFYLVNLFVNTNVTSLLLLLFPILCAFRFCAAVLRRCPDPTLTWDKLRFLVPTYVWLAIFFQQPHKEERFLTPCYTFIPLVAAVTSSQYLEMIAYVFTLPLTDKRQGGGRPRSTPHVDTKPVTSIVKVTLTSILILISLAFGASRILMQITAFSAPLALYQHLSRIELQDGLGPKQAPVEFASPMKDVNICIGREWYRFPTSFFIPDRRFRIRFVRAGFTGLLPKPFSEDEFGTRVIPNGMNEFNREDPAQFFDWQDKEGCHYFVDLDLSHRQSSSEAAQYPHPVRQNSRHIVFKQRFLDSEKSRKGFRAFYVLGFEYTLVFGEYQLIRNLELLPYT